MMMSSITRLALNPAKAVSPTFRVATQHIRPVSSASSRETESSSRRNQHRDIHNTAFRKSDVVRIGAVEKKDEKQEESSLVKRFLVTAEVSVSKIFPAGFGWQSASIVAEKLGYETDTMAFATVTGVGDALGVLLGHTAFYGAKKMVFDSSINMKREAHTGILLGSAAFCSGTAWQPLVDALQGANLSFMGVFAGTWVGCGTAFYVGLRAGRTILSGYLEHVHGPTYENSKTDTSLSVAIGGATGFFVGTDAAYLPEQNFLIDVVGIKEGTSDLVGCAIAGTSTTLGFGTAQTGLNAVIPTGKCWND